MPPEPTWQIGPQTREASQARFTARMEAIFAQAGVVHNPALRAAADRQDAERRAEYAALANATNGSTEAKEAARIGHENKRRPWADRVRAA